MYSNRFISATEKLVNAFLMDKLEHGNYCGCAVGSLCDGDGSWNYLRYAGSTTGLPAIAKSGYSPMEIFEIEKNFEGRKRSAYDTHHWEGSSLNSIDDRDGFKGLCNVFDYLISLEDYEGCGEQIKLTELLQQQFS